jgi:hypothetical protein
MQYAAYHFEVNDIRSIVPEGQEMLMIGRWLSRHLPSVARLDVMHGVATSSLTEGPGYVIAITSLDKTTRASIDAQLHKMKGYKGMRMIELGHEAGYDLVKGRIPKP